MWLISYIRRTVTAHQDNKDYRQVETVLHPVVWLRKKKIDLKKNNICAISYLIVNTIEYTAEERGTP